MNLLVINIEISPLFSSDHPHSYLKMSSYLDVTKPEYDNSQLSSHIDSQFDSQLTVARGPPRSAPSPISTVLKLPSNLATVRQHAFALNAELTWNADDYALYWPFVDNL